MDRYKFRGKRIDNGEWVTGYYCETCGDHFIMPKTEEVEKHDGYSYIVDPSTVGQYTNQNDIEKTELYEKDIVQHVNAKWLGVIHFADGSYRVQTTHGTWELLAARADKVVKVGNVHDNKELLEG